MGPTIAHVCTRDGCWRAGAYCGACQAPCTPTCTDCGHEVATLDHTCP